ncbi:MAG: DASS family sodium-coupled anion symporter [Campylobacteraceae bacterium]|nr:DASS family sodium-coupled anion symporter [Campylobacteraceae bacterium]
MDNKKFIWLLVAIATFFAITYLTPNIDGLTHSAKVSLGVAVFAIIVWITGAVDDALSGIMIVFLLAAFKATPKLADAFSGYSNTSLWLIVIGFIMAAGMEKSGLSKRIALLMINSAKGSAIGVYWAVFFVMAILSFLVPSITARTLLMLPIILGIGQAFGAVEGKSNIVKALVFIVAMSGTMMSLGILTAHVGNPITAGLIEQATKETISWSEWFKIGGFPAFSLATISVFVIKWMWAPEKATLGAGESYVRDELAKLGKFSRDEIYTLIVFFITLVLWATDSIHKTNVAVVGLLAVIMLLFPKGGLMSWKEAQSKVPWNVFIVYGAGLSMGAALATSGAAKWLAGTMLSPIVDYSVSMQIIILIWIVTLLQVFFTGGGPKTTALTPIIIAHATVIGADPLVFALVLGMNMQHQYMLPVSNMPNAVAMGTGHITARELMKTGFVMSVVACIYMSLMVLTFWKFIGVVN